ncbi:MAG: transcriptional regulator TbsP [Halobacteria archaeon]
MSTSLTGIDGDEMVHKSMEESGGELRLLQVSPAVLSRYVKVLSEDDGEVDTVRALVGEDALKEVMDDFLVASAASDLIEQGKLELLSTSDDSRRSLVLVGGSEVMSFVDVGGAIGAVSTDDEEIVNRGSDMFESMWENGDDFRIRTPPASRVRETLREEIGEETQEDFEEILDLLETAKGDGDGLDEITVALLAAARNEVLLYDISKWGEDSGVASKATFSRKKTELEDSGLIDTENVPIDIGRPRLRLKFSDESLHDAPLGDIVEAAKNATE